MKEIGKNTFSNRLGNFHSNQIFINNATMTPAPQIKRTLKLGCPHQWKLIGCVAQTIKN